MIVIHVHVHKSVKLSKWAFHVEEHTIHRPIHRPIYRPILVAGKWQKRTVILSCNIWM